MGWRIPTPGYFLQRGTCHEKIEVERNADPVKFRVWTQIFTPLVRFKGNYLLFFTSRLLLQYKYNFRYLLIP